MSEPERWYEVAEVAAILGASLRTVRRMCATGELPSIKVGREWRIAASGLDALSHTSHLRSHAPASMRADRGRYEQT